MRILCRERRTALVNAIRKELGDELRVLGDQAGMYLTAALITRSRDRDISVRAAQEGLWVPPLSECYLGKTSRPGFILGYGGTSTTEIETGVARLRAVFDACDETRERPRVAPRISRVPRGAPAAAPRD
jgi:GntR family transcriptional regulator/MocR family aminotransferase